MKEVLMLLGLVLLVGCSEAVIDSVTTGPYKVSFDIGLDHADYTVSVEPPKETESLSGEKSVAYTINLKNNSGSHSALIGMTYYETPDETTPNQLASLFKQQFESEYDNVEVATREIDGTTGVAASFDASYRFLGDTVLLHRYAAIYKPAFDKNHLKVTIVSDYPWDEGTLSLLKTIHVDKAGP